MKTIQKSVPLILALVLFGASGSAQAEARRTGVAGRVLGEANPLPSAGVWAYQLADLKTTYRVKTDAQGNFLFQDLPAGLYKIIAHKTGFVPVVVMLTRATAQAAQFVEMQLAARQPGDGPAGDDFWSIRARVPADVLREIETDEAGFRLASYAPLSVSPSLPGNFQTEMQALTGVDQIAAEEGQVSGGGLGIHGKVGQVEVGLRGSFRQFDSAFQPGRMGGGQTSTLSLDLERGAASRLTLRGLNNRMTARSEEGAAAPIDFEHYQMNYSQQVGENGRSDFAAHYTAENNFHRQASFDPLQIPETSRTWLIEGAYTAAFGDRNTLQAGMRYRERQFGLSNPTREGKAYEQPALASIDLFGRGGARIQPAVLVEYGLYTKLSDGSFALTPQGGLVFQLGPHWQAAASASLRAYEDSPADPDFLPILHEQGDLCEQGSKSCYEVRLSRTVGDDNSFSIGAVHRTMADTLRFYFSEDFFDRTESLYLVPGDELPELRMSFTHRLSPKVVTTLQSSLATGGGGTFMAPGGLLPYENQVSYMVTSLDTQFQATSTGVFLAFHHLEQQLDPVLFTKAVGLGPVRNEYDRLRLMVSQDLSFLLDLATDWALQLNMELSRGTAPAQDPDELRRRFLGGIAVKF
jgi:hypothetical protein